MRTQRTRLNRRITRQKLSLFSEFSLTILVSIVTLFLQAISFVTTWSGSKVYLEGVFPYASLLFALAIQLTAYFFSNSLRNKISALKLLAMTAALCCSTYYSYIGIYNSVNSPVSFLQEKYLSISDNLTRIYEDSFEGKLSDIRLQTGDAYSKVNAYYSSLAEKQAVIDACKLNLAEADSSVTGKLRAPKQASYETYEEYAAAYRAYIEAISAGSKSEKDAVRADILSSYGFQDMETLNRTSEETKASLSALYAALGITDAEENDPTETITALYLRAVMTIDAATAGTVPTDTDLLAFTYLFQGARLCDANNYHQSDIAGTLALCAKASSHTLLADYQMLVDALPEKMVTASNTMTLKGTMDSQIFSAIINLNALLPDTEQISASDARYRITDLYLIPILALTTESTRTIAFFCLAVAALIDALSVLFALSVKKRRAVWKRSFLRFQNPEEYLPQICAALADPLRPTQSLCDFLSWFAPSPETENDGYMMKASMNNLSAFAPLTALLCQINLAKVIPGDLLDSDSDILLLRARFVLWATELIYENSNLLKEASQ